MYFRIILINIFINLVNADYLNATRPILSENIFSSRITSRINFIFYPPGIDDINQATVYPYKYGCNIIDNPKYDSNLSTIIFQHGYRENCFLTNNRMSCGIVASAVAQFGKANLIIVSYNKLINAMFNADWLDYPRAVMNIRSMGPALCKFYQCFFKECNCKSTTKVIGFSLGAQEIHVTFKNCKIKPDYAVGLDPAGPLFFPGQSLNKNDAKYLQVVHTNPGGALSLSPRGPYGNVLNSATISFWMNVDNAPIQPICKLNRTLLAIYSDRINLCSHYMSVRYFMRTLNNPTAYLGHECNSINPSKEYMGFGAKESTTGLYCVDADS